MKEITIVSPKDFHEKDFEVKDKKIRTKKKFDTYVCTYAAGKDVVTTASPAQYNDDSRHQLQVLNGIGKLHLDFVPAKDLANANLFTLPANAPKNLALIETQTHDGGFVWLGPNMRNVVGVNLKKGVRYVVDIIGFFE